VQGVFVAPVVGLYGHNFNMQNLWALAKPFESCNTNRCSGLTIYTSDLYTFCKMLQNFTRSFGAHIISSGDYFF